MKKHSAYSKTSWLLALVFFVLIGNAQSQDLFRDVEKVKSEVSDLKDQISQLRTTVLELRKALLQSATATGRQESEKTQPKQEKPVKPEPPMDEAELTKIICRAVGTFFTEAESVLRSSNADAAQAGMKKAFQKLNDSLRDYSRTHRAAKLLNIYDGLAWDTYSAVELQGSVAGNEKFMKVLAEHKKKYTETCPKE
ncbi:MAG: hypothetical protein LDL33_07950 [Desulfomonile sp.]|nr:hypothetical protein [Desulfomonile sp.]